MTIIEGRTVGAEVAAADHIVPNRDHDLPGNNLELQAWKPWNRDRRYKPRLMSRWLSPMQLFDAGVRERIAGTFESFSDRREVLATREAVVLAQSSLPKATGLGEPLPRRSLLPERSGEEADHSDGFWFDYVADVGDGFSTTYAIAEEIAMTNLEIKSKRYDLDEGAVGSAAAEWRDEIRGHEADVLRRGDLLIMGGDQVYPLASDDEYRNRTVGPYETACRSNEDRPMAVLAVPGNHDWYDGLSAFLTRFCAEGWIGAWQTRQTRSYWAAKLAENWWVWGIDIGLEHTPIDHHQLAYFRAAANELAGGDRIILVTSKPSWLMSEPASSIGRKLSGRRSEAMTPEEYEELSYFMSTTLTDRVDMKNYPDPPRFALVLSGDKHFYCRHDNAHDNAHGTADEPRLPHVVAGGGGAYLSLPYGLVERLRLPLEWRANGDDEHTTLTTAQQWPSARQTHSVGVRSIVRMITRNWGFCAALAALYVAMAAIVGFDKFEGAESVGGFMATAVANFEVLLSELRWNPLWLIMVLALLGLGTFQNPRSWLERIAVSAIIVGLQLVGLAVSATLAPVPLDGWLGLENSTWAAIAIGIAAAAWVAWIGRMLFYLRRMPSMAFWGSIGLIAVALALYFDLLDLIFGWSDTSYAWIFVLGGIASLVSGVMFALSMLAAVYLFGVHDNFLSVAARESGFKNFLRLNIDQDSNLHVYAIGFERVPHKRLTWRTESTGCVAGDSAADHSRDCASVHRAGCAAIDTPEVVSMLPRGHRPSGRKGHTYEPRLIDAFTVWRSGREPDS